MRKGVQILAAIFLLGFLATGISQIQPGERGLVRRFGRFVGQAGPGLRIGWPFPIERVDRVALDVPRQLAVGYRPDRDEEDLSPSGQMLTGDQNLINVQVLVEYTLAPDGLEEYLLQAGRVEEFLSRATESILAEWIGARPIDDVQLLGKLELPRQLAQKLQQRADAYGLGIVVGRSSVPYLNPPLEVKLAFEEVNRAHTAIKTRTSEAEQEANRRVLQAKADANRIETLGRAYAVDQRLMAEADANRFEHRLDQYRRLSRDNAAYLSALWWEEMGSMLTKLKQNGRIDFLDNHLGADGLDIITAPAPPGKKQ